MFRLRALFRLVLFQILEYLLLEKLCIFAY
jgi:hypothetical protein